MAIYKKTNLYYFRLAFFVLGRFPGCKCRWGCRDKFIVWEYTYISQITHKPFSLCLNYEINFDPRIWVIEPDFTQLQPSELRHVYTTQSNRLCLFHPRDTPWNPHKDIVTTAITWTFLWIEFYEAWKITGTWYGAEADHTVQKNNQKSEKSNKKKQGQKPKFLQDKPVRY